MDSIESAYMSIARWAVGHWGSLDWFPWWYGGMPYFRVYQPGLHVSVAALAQVSGWTVQHAYHFLTATTFCLAPVTLFWLCYVASRSVFAGLTAGLFYSLISPSTLLVKVVAADTDGLFTGRRFVILTRYGEGPHTTAVMMIPAILLLLHYAMTEQKRWAVVAAPFALAALVLTNWPGTVGLALAVVPYLLSRVGASKAVNYPISIALAVCGYLLTAPWLPPSLVFAIQKNAQTADTTKLGGGQLLSAVLALAIIGVLHWILERWKVNPWTRFFAYYALLSGAVALGNDWFGWRLLPQPNRFYLEFELALAGLLGMALHFFYQRSSPYGKVLLAVLVVGICGSQVASYRQYVNAQLPPFDITKRVEYRLAKWFEANMAGRRVFAPGNISFWMNMFTDTPQVAGCCDQSVPDQEQRIAVYVIYSGDGTGDREVENSLLWLRAYGADAVGVTGPKSEEPFHPVRNFKKFDGVLPVLWREGQDAVYDVPRRSRSLAHVLPASRLVTVPPANGIDVKELAPFVEALESTEFTPASFRWEGTRRALIEAEARAGELASLRVKSSATGGLIVVIVRL